MKFLLDTNIWSLYFRGDSHIIAHIKSQTADSLFLCSVVEAELWTGIKKAPSPRLLVFVETLIKEFESIVFCSNAAKEYGRIRAHLEKSGKIIGGNDLMIASIALTHQLTLVSRNTAEFKRIPDLLLSDWSQ